MNKETPRHDNRKWRALRLARRISQTVFLLLFLWLIGITVSVTGAPTKGLF